MFQQRTFLSYLLLITVAFYTFSGLTILHAGEFKVRLYQYSVPERLKDSTPEKGKNIQRPSQVSRKSQKAIVLIHGLNPKYIQNSEKYDQPIEAPWQNRNSEIVQTLDAHGDVFGIVYSQNRPVDDIANFPGFYLIFNQLKKAGYKDIVLIGSSAGGVISRIYVEDRPNPRVSRVIQVSAPNLGNRLSKIAGLDDSLDVIENKDFLDFIKSLKPEERKNVTRARRHLEIPDRIEFSSITGVLQLDTDGIVARSSAWDKYLRRQGIPGVSAIYVHGKHMQNPHAIQWIKRLITHDINRNLSRKERKKLLSIYDRKEELLIWNPELILGEINQQLRKLDQKIEDLVLIPPSKS